MIGQKNTTNNSLCYGFIIPLPQGLDTTNETFENSRVRHLINDLLRENVTVFWLKDTFALKSKKLNSDDPMTEMFYKRGAFIIPFYGNESNDALLTSIINDYNQTHELENQNTIKNEAYIVQETITTITDKLVEPKIVQHLGQPIRYSWPVYLQQADDGGFLTIEYLLDNETEKFLNNKDYNLFIWPYLPDKATYYEQYKTFINTRQTNSIRNFVNNGGGFIGTCYGAYAASSGAVFFTTPLSISYAYNPEYSKILPSSSLSLCDSLMRVHLDALVTNYLSIHNVEKVDHPVFYGVNHTFQDFFKGPLWAWIGKNTHVLTTIIDLKNFSGGSDVNEKTKSTVIGRPGWIETKFGKGKVVLYSTHPDFVNNIKPLFMDREWEGDRYYGRRIIHNTMFYVVSEDNVNLTTTTGINLSFVESVIEKTNDLPFNESPDNNFNETYQKLSTFYNHTHGFCNTIKILQKMFVPVDNNSFIFKHGSTFLQYVHWYGEIYKDYINRTLEIIDKLENITPLIEDVDASISEKIAILKNDINQRLNHSEELLEQVVKVAERLKATLESSKISIMKKIQLLRDRRTLLEQYEIGLKYIPQLYFETLKLLRYSWYTYEAHVATLTD